MTIFVTDGGSDSFFTAVYAAFNTEGSRITSATDIQMQLDTQIIKTEPDNVLCQKAVNTISKYDKRCVNDVNLVLRSNSPQKEQIAFEYIKRLIAAKAPISKAFNLSETVNFVTLREKVTGEVHKLSGFLRFMESADGIFYAPYSPDNDITELLMPHFATRFSAERFVIHDIGRGIAGIYDGKHWLLTYAGEAEINLSQSEKAFERLWKLYYKSTDIKERPHEKQMKNYMPVRYWKFLPEKRP